MDKKKLAIISVVIIAILIIMGGIKIKNTRDEKLWAEKVMAEKIEARRIEAEEIEAEKAEAEKAEIEKEAAEKAEAERIETERIEAEKAEAERLAALNPLESIEVSYGVYDVNHSNIIAKPAPFENVIHFYEDIGMKVNGSVIASTRPGSELTLSFKNTGDTIPKDPSIIFQFDDIILHPEVSDRLQYYDDGMEASNHAHGMGYYTTFKWYLGSRNILYKDQAITMYNIPFGGSELDNGYYTDLTGRLTITLVDSEANKVEYNFIIETEAP